MLVELSNARPSINAAIDCCIHIGAEFDGIVERAQAPHGLLALRARISARYSFSRPMDLLSERSLSCSFGMASNATLR